MQQIKYILILEMKVFYWALHQLKITAQICVFYGCLFMYKNSIS